jgi:gamma-glutamyltranspeptidase/glutathione hydrolase
VVPSVVAGPPGAAAVAAGSATAADAAARVLDSGGNAVDAALAATVAAAIAEPGLTSLGGGGFLMARSPSGDLRLFDFFVAAPGIGAGSAVPEMHEVVVRFAGADQVFHCGPGSVAVPGLVDGVVAAHRALGRAPLAQVLAPAIDAARAGVPVEPAQAQVLALLAEVFALTLESARIYTDDGRPLREGDRLDNPDLADLLLAVADGAITGVASSALAEPLLGTMHGGAAIHAADLAAYRVIERSPRVQPLPSWAGTGFMLATNPPPSFGGSVVAGALAALPGAGYPERRSWLPRLVAEATDRIKQELPAGQDSVRGTTHVSVVDRDGAAASVTTSNGSCSGVVVPGTGIQLNNMLGEEDLQPGGLHSGRPGDRLRSMMAPSVLVGGDGSVTALGSGGSERIRTAIARVVHALASGVGLHEAVLAPRMHLDDAGLLHHEPGIDPGELAAAQQVIAGSGPVAQVNAWADRDLYFGGVNAVQRRADGSVVAIGDPRRGGSARVV